MSVGWCEFNIVIVVISSQFHRWTTKSDDPNWITSGTVKLLLELCQLSELDLLIKWDQDMKHIAKCFSRLHNLRKLKIHVCLWCESWNRPHPMNDLGRIIGANLNLTHIELYQDDDGYPVAGNLSQIFGYVPSGSPLKLEHLGLSNNLSDALAIAPHARSLRSITLCGYRSNGILPVLYAESIFPPIIEASRGDDLLISYLNHHPQIVSLSIHCIDPEFLGQTILEIMAQHSESLKYFSTSFPCLSVSLHVQTEHLLLRCTKLEQLTIWYRNNYFSPTEFEELVGRQWSNVAFTEIYLLVHYKIANYCSSIEFIDVDDH